MCVLRAQRREVRVWLRRSPAVGYLTILVRKRCGGGWRLVGVYGLWSGLTRGETSVVQSGTVLPSLYFAHLSNDHQPTSVDIHPSSRYHAYRPPKTIRLASDGVGSNPERPCADEVVGCCVGRRTVWLVLPCRILNRCLWVAPSCFLQLVEHQPNFVHVSKTIGLAHADPCRLLVLPLRSSPRSFPRRPRFFEVVGCLVSSARMCRWPLSSSFDQIKKLTNAYRTKWNTQTRDSLYVQEHPAKTFVQDAGFIGRGWPFGPPGFFRKNATKMRGGAA